MTTSLHPTYQPDYSGEKELDLPICQWSDMPTWWTNLIEVSEGVFINKKYLNDYNQLLNSIAL